MVLTCQTKSNGRQIAINVLWYLRKPDTGKNLFFFIVIV